jgi:hypothetical protein
MRLIKKLNATFVLRRRGGPAIVALSVALAFAPAASRAGDETKPAANQNQGVLKSVLKKANMATDDVGRPQDFVVNSRPAAPQDYVPVFRQNEEHKTKVLTPDQLKAMEADLDAASDRNGHIRDAFPPARRAHQQEEREKAAKAAAKKAKTPATATVQ